MGDGDSAPRAPSASPIWATLQKLWLTRALQISAPRV